MPNKQALRTSFHRQVMLRLLEMLEILRQRENPENRSRLQARCQPLLELGRQAQLPAWVELMEVSLAALANAAIPYTTSGKLIVKEIKQAADLVLAGCAEQIRPSAELRSLTPQVDLVSVAAGADGEKETLIGELADFWEEEPPEHETLAFPEEEHWETSPPAAAATSDLFAEDSSSKQESPQEVDLDFLVVAPTAENSSAASVEDFASLFGLDSTGEQDNLHFKPEAEPQATSPWTSSSSCSVSLRPEKSQNLHLQLQIQSPKVIVSQLTSMSLWQN